MKKIYFVNYYDFSSIKYLRFIKQGECSKSSRQIESNFISWRYTSANCCTIIICLIISCRLEQSFANMIWLNLLVSAIYKMSSLPRFRQCRLDFFVLKRGETTKTSFTKQNQKQNRLIFINQLCFLLHISKAIIITRFLKLF